MIKTKIERVQGTPKVRPSAKAVAGVIGLKLFARGPRAAAQNEALLGLIKAGAVAADGRVLAPFPPAVKGWVTVAALREFAAAHLVLAKDKRTFALNEKSGVRSQESGAEIPSAEKPSEGELFQKLSAEELAQQQQRRLDYFEDIHLNPGRRLNPSGQSFLKLNPREEKDLKSARPWLFNLASKPGEADDSAASGVNITGGFRGVANYINNNFSGVIVSHTSIQNWMKGTTLPEGCRENFPASESSGSNRWKKAEVDTWVNRYLRPLGGTQQGLVRVDDVSRQQKADADIAVMKSEAMQRALSNKYMEAKLVLGFTAGFARWIGLQQDKFIEDRNGVRKIVAALVTEFFKPPPEQLTAFDTRLGADLAAANDAMKVACGHHKKELLARLVEEREKQINEEMNKA